MRLYTTTVAILCFFFFAVNLNAQAEQRAERLELTKGSVAVIAPGTFGIRLHGEPWLVRPAPNAKVEISGVASREMLQKGQFIQCNVMMNEIGKVLDPVKRITFSGGGEPGVVAEGLGIAGPGAKRAPGGKRPAGSYLVSGQIFLVQENTVTVQAGARDKVELTIPLDAELIVMGGMPLMGLVSVGDIVETEGSYYEKGKLEAVELRITLTKPVTPPPLKSQKVAPKKSSSKKKKPDAEEKSADDPVPPADAPDNAADQ